MILKLEQFVRVRRNHWARGGDGGIVEELLEGGRVLVMFERPGVGFDGEIQSETVLAKCSTERQALMVATLGKLVASATG